MIQIPFHSTWVELAAAELEKMSGEERQLAVGLISGTSMDGIDACVLEIIEEQHTDHQSANELKLSLALLTLAGRGGSGQLRVLRGSATPDYPRPVPSFSMHHSEQLGMGLGTRLNLVGFLTHPYPNKLRDELHSLCVDGSTADVCMYNVLLGKMFAQVAQLVVEKCGLSMDDIAVIGSHGQTIHHLPTPQQLHGFNITSTLQIGDPSVIAQECGVTTVGDFRMADMAVGGQGAPLVPYLDRILLKRHFLEKKRVGMLLNIGGISNVSAFIPNCLSESGDGALVGFDCGPGNVLIDSLMKKWFKKDFDKDGEKAGEGKSSAKLLERLLMEDHYIKTPPPKSTGREHYDEHYIYNVVMFMEEVKSNISREDCIATLTEFTAAAVVVNFELFIQPLMSSFKEWDLFVSGGGARNKTLMKSIEQRFKKHNVNVVTTNMLGIDPDAKEAVCFALLAYQTIKGRATNIPGVTGACKEVVLGKICPVQRSKTISSTS